jgi:LysM repeat protein
MKTLIYVFVAVTLLASLFFSPVLAAPVSAAACGDTYTVAHGDYLSKIAYTCDIALSTIISLNPEIKDINIVYVGQVIRLKSSGTIPVTGGTGGTYGTYTVVMGDYLSLIARRFGTTTTELLRVNPAITNPSLIYIGQVLYLPSGTTSTGTGTTTGTGSALVTLSTRSAKVGAQVEVKVTGFPANAEVDLRIGKEGKAYTAVVDGKTSSSGAVTVKVTIPSAAVVGEKWVVKVMTTSIAKGVEVTSATITIIN